MDDSARAVADPVRRQILAMLRDGALTATEIGAPFDISRPAISRHLRVLREAGLVTDRSEGRHRIYTLNVAPLAAIDEWLAQFRDVDPRPNAVSRGDWGQRLDALGTEVHRTRRERRSTTDRESIIRTEERTA